MFGRCGLTNIQGEFGYDTMIHWENHYGDHFETAETAERSQWYNITAHPYARFDGLNPELGATSCLNATARYRTKVYNRLDETAWSSPVRIEGGYEESAGEASIAAVFELVDPVQLFNLRATFLIYEDNVYWCCGSGGNDTWQHVTRVIHDQEIYLINQGDKALVSATIPLDPSWNPDELHYIAYLQDTETMEIIQGFILQQGMPASTGEIAGQSLTRIEGIEPNPVRTTATVSFFLSPSDASHPIVLDVLDAGGRKVAELARGELAAGRHDVQWDRAASGIGRQASGIYFVTLTTPGGRSSAKILLLE